MVTGKGMDTVTVRGVWMGIIQKKNNLITIYVTRISRKEILA